MTGLGMGGSALPRTRPGDYERALALVATLGNDEVVKAKLTELRDAQAAQDSARERAEAAERTAGQREQAAHEAELDAKSQRDALATETEQTDARLRVERGKQATERQRLTDLSGDLEAKRLDLEEREDALKTAFRAYTGETT